MPNQDLRRHEQLLSALPHQRVISTDSCGSATMIHCCPIKSEANPLSYSFRTTELHYHFEHSRAHSSFLSIFQYKNTGSRTLPPVFMHITILSGKFALGSTGNPRRTHVSLLHFFRFLTLRIPYAYQPK